MKVFRLAASMSVCRCCWRLRFLRTRVLHHRLMDDQGAPADQGPPPQPLNPDQLQNLVAPDRPLPGYFAEPNSSCQHLSD